MPLNIENENSENIIKIIRKKNKIKWILKILYFF
jgi:hypothetical protein